MLIFLGVCFGPRRHRVSLAIAIAIASSGYGLAMAISMSASAASKVFVHSLSLCPKADWALLFVYFTLSCPSLLYTHPTHPSSPPLTACETYGKPGRGSNLC